MNIFRVESRLKEGLTSEHTFEPKLKSSMPDFKELHKRMKPLLRFYPNNDPVKCTIRHQRSKRDTAQVSRQRLLLVRYLMTRSIRLYLRQDATRLPGMCVIQSQVGSKPSGIKRT
jgi:hypothetical protein